MNTKRFETLENTIRQVQIEKQLDEHTLYGKLV